MPNRQDAASSPRESMENFLQSPLPETTDELEGQIASIRQAQAENQAKIKDLMSRENLDLDMHFAREIHKLRQDNNMLDVQAEYRRVRLNRLSLEQQE